MANSYYSHNTLMALGDVLARLLEISMIEVSDIIDDFVEHILLAHTKYWEQADITIKVICNEDN